MKLISSNIFDWKTWTLLASIALAMSCGGGGGGSDSSSTSHESTPVATAPVSSGGAAVISSPAFEIEEQEPAAPPTLTFQASKQTVTEGESISISAVLSYPLANNISFNLATSGSATSGDYALPTTALVIEAGHTQVSFALITTDDSDIESVETIAIDAVDLSNSEVTPFSTSVLIEDNDFNQPTDFTGMILHFSASEGITADPDTGAIASWVDKTGVHTAVPSGGNVSFQPASSYEGLPGVSFDSTGGFLSVPNHITLNEGTEYPEKTILMVFHTGDDITTRQMIYEQGGGTRGLSLYIFEGLLYQCAWNNRSEGGFTAWTPQCVTSPAIKNTINFTALRFDQPNGEMAAFVGYKKVDTLPAPGKIFGHAGLIGLGDVADNSLTHDLVQSANHPFTGTLYEYITYNNALTDTEIAGIYNSLNPTYKFNSVKSFALESAGAQITEGQPVEFSISVSSPYSESVTFDISISGEVSAPDYTLANSQVTLPAGASSVNFIVQTNVDAEFELIEQMNVSITSSQEVNIAISELSVSVEDDVGDLLSSMTAWYKPESIASIDLWENSLNSSHHITKFQTSTNSISNIGAHAAIDFAGDGIMTIANHNDYNLVQSTSKFFIVAFETSADTLTPQVIYEEGGGSNGINLYIKDDKVVGSFWYKSGGVIRYFHQAAVLPNTKYVALFYYDSISDRFLLNINRNEIGSVSVNSKPLPAHAGKIALGAMYNDTYFEAAESGNGHYFTGKISEMMYFNNPSKTDDQISSMVDYFNDKYGISP